MARSLDELVALIAELPGVGPRQARRIAQFLLHKNKSFATKLAEHLKSLHDHIAQCTRCFRFDDVDQSKLCSLCAGTARDVSQLVVVEKDVDVEGIEDAGLYRGRYFVLGSLMPLNPTRKAFISPRTAELAALIKKESSLTEVILAFATTPEGDYTAREVKKLLNEKYPKLTVSMLGRGLSLGAEIEYADHETLRNAFTGRK